MFGVKTGNLIFTQAEAVQRPQKDPGRHQRRHRGGVLGAPPPEEQQNVLFHEEGS